MARVTFVFDDDFDENIHKASNTSGSSLRPIFDQVRKTTDDIAVHAREMIAREAGRMQALVTEVKPDRFSRHGKANFNYFKAVAFALRSARDTLAPTMEYDGTEIFGRVAIYRRDSRSIEFGGIDSVAEIGKGTGVYVTHPAYAFLRRAMDRMG